MASLDELRAALLPGARVVGEETAAADDAPEIGWVRVMKARVPAFDALEAGDLAIVPGPALRLVAPGAAELEALVAAFGRARVGAVVLLDPDDAEAGDREALDALAAALRAAGLPALRTDRADAAALERSIIGFLVNRRAELEHQAAVLEARLEALALAGTDLDGLVGAIAGFLGRAVALEGPRGAPLAVHAPPGAPTGAPSTTADVARYHARPRAVGLRVSLPGSSGPAGSLALLGERPASELERVVSGRIAGSSPSSWHAAMPSGGRSTRRAGPSRCPRPARRGSFSWHASEPVGGTSTQSSRASECGGSSGSLPRRGGWRSAATPTAWSSGQSSPSTKPTRRASTSRAAWRHCWDARSRSRGRSLRQPPGRPPRPRRERR